MYLRTVSENWFPAGFSILLVSNYSYVTKTTSNQIHLCCRSGLLLTFAFALVFSSVFIERTKFLNPTRTRRTLTITKQNNDYFIVHISTSIFISIYERTGLINYSNIEKSKESIDRISIKVTTLLSALSLFSSTVGVASSS